MSVSFGSIYIFSIVYFLYFARTNLWYDKYGDDTMEKRILNYMSYIDAVLEQNSTGLSYEVILKEHEKQLAFFMHERLIHLLVTLTFGILTFAIFFLLCINFQPGLILLLLALLILLIPYIMHYYLLENGVQKMYRQYDALFEKTQKNKIGKL